MNHVRRRRRRNGSAYVLLLTGALVVVVAGVTAVRVTTANVQAQGARKQGDTAIRQAQAGLEYMLQRIAKDPGGRYWRQAARYSDSFASPTGDPSTTIQVAMKDPLDDDLTNGVWGDVDCRVRATTGDFARQIGVTLRPTMQRLRCLNLAAAAKKFSNSGGTLITLGATSVEYGTRGTSDPILVDWTGLGNATGQDLRTAQTSSNTMDDASDVRLPNEKVIDYWAALGTRITLNADQTIQKQVFSPTSNPLGATNALGIYVIDAQSNSVTFQNNRIYGTLIIYAQNANKVKFEQSNCLEPASPDRPALMISGGVTFDQVSSDLSELLQTKNFNPAGAPFLGATDSDLVDSYPSMIRGLVYVYGDVNVKQNLSIQGQFFATGTVGLQGKLHVQYYPIEGTPIGFSYPTDFKVVDRSVVRY
ncbi:MAG: hypothetical protein U0640_03890 [Phycisphaerales bacterium]